MDPRSRAQSQVPQGLKRGVFSPGAGRDPIVDVNAPVCSNPGHVVTHRVETVKKDFDLLGFYNVKVSDLDTIKGDGAYTREMAGRHTHGHPEEDLTDKFTPQQRELLKVIQTKVYEKDYRLTEVFKSFNKGRIPPGQTTGDLPAALVEEGVLRMLNMGHENPLLVKNVREMVDICTRSDGFVSYEEFAHVFKRKDTQDDPLIEGNAGDRYLWAGKVFSRQGKQGLINDNIPIPEPDAQQELLQGKSSVGEFDYGPAPKW